VLLGAIGSGVRVLGLLPSLYSFSISCVVVNKIHFSPFKKNGLGIEFMMFLMMLFMMMMLLLVFFVKFMSFGIVDVFLMIFVHGEIYDF
jgi:hypothetical protein